MMITTIMNSVCFSLAGEVSSSAILFLFSSGVFHSTQVSFSHTRYPHLQTCQGQNYRHSAHADPTFLPFQAILRKDDQKGKCHEQDSWTAERTQPK